MTQLEEHYHNERDKTVIQLQVSTVSEGATGGHNVKKRNRTAWDPSIAVQITVRSCM